MNRPTGAQCVDSFDAVKAVGRTLPGVEATTRYDGAPVLKVGGCFMAMLSTHASAESGTLIVRSGFEERACLIEEIKAMRQRTGVSFLYVTHNVDEVVQIGDQVVALNEGRVMRQGSAKEITLIQSE